MVSIRFESRLVPRKLAARFRAAMQLGGVDPSSLQLIVSAVHDDEDVARTVAAFDAAITRLADEGSIGAP